MTKEEFKKKWEKDNNRNAITYEDISNCYIKWGLGTSPKTKPIFQIRYAVMQTANTINAEEFNQKEF